MADIANFIAQNFRGPDLAGVDRAKYSNALYRNQVDRLPQQNRAEDLAIQRDEQALNAGRVENALGVLDRQLAMIEASPRARETATQITSSPDFQSLTQFLKLPPIQLAPEDTDDTLRAEAQQLRQALRGVSSQQRVQSTQVLEDGTIAYVTSDGQLVRTGEKARNPLQAIEVAGGRAAFDPRSGQTRPITTAEQETQAAANLKRAETEAAQGVVPADARAAAAAKSPRLAAAERRLARVAEASRALGEGGGPLEGRLRSMVGTPAAQELDAANAQLINELTALTRVPGVGSQSDLEQRLAQLQLPNASQHPSVRARSIQEMEAFIADLGAALNSVAAPQGQQNGLPDFTNMSDEDLMRIINGQ